jgi:N-acetylmuramoyl-L-alanine amidase
VPAPGGPLRAPGWPAARRGLAAALALCLALGGAWWVQRRVRASTLAAAAYSLRGRVVAVDPGHGGIDPGALGPGGIIEDTVVLAVSLKLAAMLEQAGAIVVLTRTGSSDLPSATAGGPTARRRVDLRTRVQLVNQAAADVLVSVHANHFSNPAERGAQTFYNAQRFPESRELAALMQEQLRRVTGETRRSISEHIDHYVLNHSNMPAVTVEIGFLSNPSEARLLARPDYQSRVAYAIFTALALWFARLPEPGAPGPSAPAPHAPAGSLTGPSSPRPHTGRSR